MPDFHDVLFPEDISYGSTGGPGFNTTVIELSSGAEQRNINWSKAKATYEVSHGIKTREQMEELQDFFMARRGKAYGFRFKDWADFEVENTIIALGDGTKTEFQIVKYYEPLTDFTYVREITKIVPDTLVVKVNGVVATPTVDISTGKITFTVAPAADAEIMVSCEFHVPVRFDTDEMKISHDDFETMSWPSIPLVELKAR